VLGGKKSEEPKAALAPKKAEWKEAASSKDVMKAFKNA